MNIFLGIELADAVNRLKAYEDEKDTAIDIGSFVCKHYIAEEAEGINGLVENDISSAFDTMIAKLLSDIDIARAEGKSIPLFTQDDLVKISKAGNYVRYAAYDLIKGLKAFHAGEKTNFDQIMIDAIDRKIEEDKIDPATEEEVEKLISDTDNIMDTLDDDEVSNPFYEDGGKENVDEQSTWHATNSDDTGEQEQN